MSHLRFPPVWTSALVVVAGLALSACGGGDAPPAADPYADEPAPAPSNRIDIPAAVRRNLGITFAKVGPRNVGSTLRAPGGFELTPAAHRAYPSTLAGHVEIAVAEYVPVKAGDLLFRVRSPAWLEIQQGLAQTIVEVRQAQARLEAVHGRIRAHEVYEARVGAQKGVWQERLDKIEAFRAAGSGQATARTEALAALAELDTTRAKAEEEHAEHIGDRGTLEALIQGYRDTSPLLYAEAMGEPMPTSDGPLPSDLSLARAAAALGVTVRHLVEPAGEPARPRWHSLERLEVRATKPGVVESLSVADGAWIERGALVLETVDLSRQRFRAVGLQSDLALIRDGMTAMVLPPDAGGMPTRTGMEGVLTLGLEADPLTRKVDLIVTPAEGALPSWVRPGMASTVEIVLEKSEGLLAIPLKSVIQDGLDRVLFRRDPKDKDKVIRVVADLGVDDGVWVVVESGLRNGDQVVLQGVYELMLAGGAAKQTGGHFHADGTWHAEDH